MSKNTYVIQIGNSDDKLSQEAWADFIKSADLYIQSLRPGEVHFSGSSNPTAPWQNYCWVIELDNAMFAPLKAQLEYYARTYNQNSIALTMGTTTFITPL